LGLDRLKSALVALGLKCGGYVTNTLDIVRVTFTEFEGYVSSFRVPYQAFSSLQLARGMGR